MLKIGLTGGIGSGKTTVSKIFQNLGVPIFNSDLVARNIVNTNQMAISQIKSVFGDDIYVNNELDRKKLAPIVFNDTLMLDKLNAIVHPIVAQAYAKWCKEHDHYPFTIKEAAILFETGVHHNLDRIIVVYTPKEERIKRIMARDNADREDVESRMANQWSDESRNKMADFIIINDQQDQLLPQVMELNELLLNIEK